MKPAAQLLAVLLATVLPAAAQLSTPPAESPLKPAAEKPATLSPETKQLLTGVLPKYTPPAPAKPEAKPEAKPDPDVVVLEKMIVTQKKRPRLGDEVLLTPQAFNDKLAKEKTSAFDRSFLNKSAWLGPYSAAERARIDYDYEKRQQFVADVFHMAKVVEQENPEQAKALRDAVTKP